MQFFTCLCLLVPLMLFFHLTHSVTADHEGTATGVRSADHTLKRLVHHVHQAPKRGPVQSRAATLHGLHNENNENDGDKKKRKNDLSVNLALDVLANYLKKPGDLTKAQDNLDRIGR